MGFRHESQGIEDKDCNCFVCSHDDYDECEDLQCRCCSLDCYGVRFGRKTPRYE